MPFLSTMFFLFVFFFFLGEFWPHCIFQTLSFPICVVNIKHHVAPCSYFHYFSEMEELGFKEPFKVLPSPRHLHHASACLAARGSDTTCQKSWQRSDALMEPNVPQQIRDGRVLKKALLMHRSCRTAARRCDAFICCRRSTLSIPSSPRDWCVYAVNGNQQGNG